MLILCLPAVGGSAAATHGSHDGTHPALDGSSSGFAHAHAHAPSTHNSALDRVLEALLSERGHSLVSVAVSLGARNLVTGFCEVRHRLAAADRAAAGLGPQLPGAQPDLTNRLLDFLATQRGQQLVRIRSRLCRCWLGGLRPCLHVVWEAERLFLSVDQPACKHTKSARCPTASCCLRQVCDFAAAGGAVRQRVCDGRHARLPGPDARPQLL